MSGQKPRLGFIGLGIMGGPMTVNLLKEGYQVTVYNRTASKAQKLVEKGAAKAESPAEVARVSDVVIVMVSDSPDVEEVILGTRGVIEEARPGLLVIDMSTISPGVTRKISAKLREKGVEMLDAPVSGGEKGAIEGKLTILVGGNKDVYQRCLPILEVMGQKITYFGESGAGQSTKLCNQIICSVTLLGVCEGLTYAAKSGLDLEKVISALSGGSAQSWLLSNFGPKIIERDFKPGFLVKLEQKDLRLVLEAAKGLGVTLPGVSIAHQLYNSVEEEKDGGMLGHHSLVKALEKLADFEVKK